MKTSVVLIGAALIAAGTWLGFPTGAPIVSGALIGLVWPLRPARHAALAGVAGWGVILGLALVRGMPLGLLGARLGGAMGVPGWAPLAVTLFYPAVLASAAAWLAALVSPRRRPHRPTSPDPAVAARQRRPAA